MQMASHRNPFASRLALMALFAICALMDGAHGQSVAPQKKALPESATFCPTWAEAHERSLASLNNGHPPFAVRWKGCIRLKKGQPVDVVGSDAGGTEIVYQNRHWFADDPLF
jgi:hypothetical protein